MALCSGAPVELMRFEEVSCGPAESVFNWARQNVTSSLYICWVHKRHCTIFMEYPNMS